MQLMRLGPVGSERPVVRIPWGSTTIDAEVELGIDGLGTQRQAVVGPH